MLIRADARSLPLVDGCIDCVVTSPPYFGLRDYGHGDQIGLEPTPDAYVASLVQVFRELRRVLKDNGTVWLNLGDSYAAGGKGGGGSFMAERRDAAWQKQSSLNGWRRQPAGFKEKDLLGIPWSVAKALQAPQYQGEIASELDRVWLAAAIDAEGCIFIHKRKAGQNNGQGYERVNDSYGSGLEVANTSEAFVQRCLDITGKGSICHQDGHGRKQRLFRWNLRSNECRNVLAEVYPYLVAKRQQARLAIGCPSSGREAEVAHEALKHLHKGWGTYVDFPAPASLFMPGWYLRSDIIWSKSNPMPESVTDRPTKAHEYLFLLSKSERYHYDADAIREALSAWELRDGQMVNTQGGQGFAVTRRAEMYPGMAGKALSGNMAPGKHITPNPAGRNKRSVWTVPTMPYSGAHFATMPEALVEPCILAGCPLGGLVLDPFIGSGTVGAVAERLGRRWVGTDLSYQPLARKRTAQRGIRFEPEEVA